MGKSNAEFFVGMDVSDKSVEIYILNREGEEGKAVKVKNEQKSLAAFADAFADPSEVKIALETGTHSIWMAELLRSKGLDVTVADARKLRAIWQSDKKCDERDAEMLARLLRADPKLLGSVRVKDVKIREALVTIKARDCLAESRVKIINTVRGLLKAEGVRSSEICAHGFGTKIRALIPKTMRSALTPLVDEITRLDAVLRQYDKELLRLRKEFDGCDKVGQIKGVGPVTSLTFVLMVGDPERFQNGERLASYLGLVPRRDQSGEVDRQCHITKAGNMLLRKYLVQSAHYVMGPFADRTCDLRRFGDRISARGGKNAKKRAIVAVARKLGVLMLKLWRSGAEYDPQYLENGKSSPESKAAA